MDEGRQFLVALGGNLPSSVGDPAETLRAGLAYLTQKGAVVRAVSRFYQTPCFPSGAGPDYVNAAADISFDGTPQEVLEVLHEAEAHFGRKRVERWGRRTLDIDLLAAGNEVLPDLETYDRWRQLAPGDQINTSPDALILPHPRLQDRAFVLVPLAEIAPDWRHPVLNTTVRQMLEALSDDEKNAVVAL